jgi:membrane fusion protein
MILIEKIDFGHVSFFSKAFFSACLLAFLASVLSQGDYSKKVAIRGYVKGSNEEYLVIAPIDGQVVIKNYSINDSVNMGDLLIAVGSHDFVEIDGSKVPTYRYVNNQYEEIRTRTAADKDNTKQHFDSVILQINTQIATSRKAKQVSQSTYNLLMEKINTSQKRITKYEKSKTLSEQQLIDYKNALDMLIIERKNIEIQMIESDNRSDVLSERKLSEKSKKLEKLSQLDRLFQQNEFDEKESTNNLRRNLFSTMKGKVTMDSVFLGKSVRRGDHLLRVLGDQQSIDEQFIGVILVGQEGIGKIKVGQSLKVKMDAFPYAHYGSFDSTVLTIQESPTLPSSVTYNSSMDSKLGPVYLAEVELSGHQFREKNIQLKTGMTFNSDIKTKGRTIFEWIFEPFFEAYNRKFKL